MMNAKPNEPRPEDKVATVIRECEAAADEVVKAGEEHESRLTKSGKVRRPTGIVKKKTGPE